MRAAHPAARRRRAGPSARSTTFAQTNGRALSRVSCHNDRGRPPRRIRGDHHEFPLVTPEIDVCLFDPAGVGSTKAPRLPLEVNFEEVQPSVGGADVQACFGQ